MQKTKEPFFPADLFAQAMRSDRENLTAKDMRLLVSGLTALHQAQGRCLNAIEMTAVTAMIAYTAYRQQVSEDKVRALLAAQFSVFDLSRIPSLQYANVIQFLTDLDVPRLLN